MPGLDIKDWAKTQDGKETIAGQQPFILNGQIWQGYAMIPVPVHEGQVTTEELRSYPDKDGTAGEVWRKRRERLQSRTTRKSNEIDETLAKLRQQRLEIRNTIKADREDKLPVSPETSDALTRIDARMQRLVDLRKQQEADFEAALAREIGDLDKPAESEISASFNPDDYKCGECGKIPRPDHPSPDKWLNMHQVAKHKKRKAS